MRKNLLIALFLSVTLASVVFAGTNINKNDKYKNPQTSTYHNPPFQNLGTYGNQPPMIPYGNMYGNRPPMPPYGNTYGNRPPMPPYGNTYGKKPPKQNPFAKNYPVTLPLFDESRPVAQ